MYVWGTLTHTHTHTHWFLYGNEWTQTLYKKETFTLLPPANYITALKELTLCVCVCVHVSE